MKLKNLFLSFIALCTLPLSGCSVIQYLIEVNTPKPEKEPEVYTLELNATELTLKYQERFQLKLLDQYGKNRLNYTDCVIEDEQIAYFDKDYTLVGYEPGETDVVVTVMADYAEEHSIDPVEYRCHVTVIDIDDPEYLFISEYGPFERKVNNEEGTGDKTSLNWSYTKNSDTTRISSSREHRYKSPDPNNNYTITYNYYAYIDFSWGSFRDGLFKIYLEEFYNGSSGYRTTKHYFTFHNAYINFDSNNQKISLSEVSKNSYTATSPTTSVAWTEEWILEKFEMFNEAISFTNEMIETYNSTLVLF